jgi:hypothetical protein
MPGGSASGNHNLNLIVNAFYPFKVSDDFLCHLLEVVGRKAPPKYHHTVVVITGEVSQSQVRVVP